MMGTRKKIQAHGGMLGVLQYTYWIGLLTDGPLLFSGHVADAAQEILDQCGGDKDTVSGKFCLLMLLCLCKRG